MELRWDRGSALPGNKLYSCQFSGFFNRLFNGTNNVEGLLREVIVLTGNDFLEAFGGRPGPRLTTLNTVCPSSSKASKPVICVVAGLIDRMR